MEFVDGETVGQVLDRERRLGEGRALGMVRSVALALDHAWGIGIVHRDVKPDNILIARDGTVKLADLGLARSVERRDRLTLRGTGLGTPDYMSPEQVRGDDDIDTRSDIYSLGATLFHMVTGTTPFDGPTVQATAIKQATEPVPDPRSRVGGLSDAVAHLIIWMMRKEREGRPQSPADLIGAMDTAFPAVRPGSTTLPRAGPVGGVIPTPRGVTWVVPVLAAVAVVLCAALGGVVLLSRPTRERGQLPPTPAPKSETRLATDVPPRPKTETKVDTRTAPPPSEPDPDEAEDEAERLRLHQDAMSEGDRLSRNEERLLDALKAADAARELARTPVEKDNAQLLRDKVLSAIEDRGKRADNKATAATILATGERLLADHKWVEATEVFCKALAVPGHDKDQGALNGIKRAQAGAQDEERRRKAHDEAIARARSALAKNDCETAAAEARAAQTHLPDSKEAKQILDELEPKLEVVAVVGGREYTGAQITIGGRVMRDRTPGTFSVEEGKTYSIKVNVPEHGDRRYVEAAETITVRRKGKHTLRVLIKEDSRPLSAADVATRRQADMARELGVKPEAEVDLGGGTKLTLVLIPPGTFRMGSPPDETGRGGDEDHKTVTIAAAFWMGKYEVTAAQFDAFARDSGYKTEAEKKGGADSWLDKGWGFTAGMSWRHPTLMPTPAHPVACLTWNDARSFTDWLSKKARVPFALPTEAQWEYACRAGTATRFYFGAADADLHKHGNYADRSAQTRPAATAPSDGFAVTAPVGQFPPNPWGLCDMYGNVCEWTASASAPRYDGTEQKGADVKTHTRVLRGGSWIDDPTKCRSAKRFHFEHNRTDVYFGFRVVRPQ